MTGSSAKAIQNAIDKAKQIAREKPIDHDVSEAIEALCNAVDWLLGEVRHMGATY